MRRARHAGPFAAALAGHAALVALLLLAVPRRLPPPAEPLAVALVPLAPPAPLAPESEVEPGPVGADLSDPPPVEATAITFAPAPAPPRPRPVAPPRPAVPAASNAEAPAVTAPAATAPVAAVAIAAWQAALSAWIDRNRRYPPAARLRQEEGVVQVRFHLDPDGRVLAIALAASSGSNILDGAAQALLTGATLPAPPPGLDAARRQVTVAIRYRLE